MNKNFFILLLAILSFNSLSSFGSDLDFNEELNDFDIITKTIEQHSRHNDPTSYKQEGYHNFYLAYLAENRKDKVNYLIHTRQGLDNFYQQIRLGDPTLAKTARDHHAKLTTEENAISHAYRISKVEIANFFHKKREFLENTGFEFDPARMFRADTGEQLIEHIDMQIELEMEKKKY